MRKVSAEDKLFYFERNFFTLDGLWMIETEKEINWETALKIDKAVWSKLLRIIFRRLKKYLKIKTNNLNDLIEILSFRWSVEGWEYDVLRSEDDEVIIEIIKCPYMAMMDRNPERKERIPLICKKMCIPFYKEIVEDFNSDIQVERSNFIGLGDNICDFRFKTTER